MGNNIKTQIGNIIGNTLNSYHSKVKPIIDDLKFRQEYQDRIIECMVGEVDDNYIETPETNEPIVKLEHSKEGLVKVPSIKGKTILVDADGNETDTPAEGCRLVSVGEDEDNKLIILSKNKNLFSEIEIGGISSASGLNTVTSSNFRSKNFDRCYPNVQVQATCGNENLVVQLIHLYDKNYKHLGFVSKGGITPANTRFVKVVGRYSHSNNGTDVSPYLDTANVQIEIGATPTSYVPSKQHKTEILLDEPLRGIDNIKDQLNFKNGNFILERNFKQIILDGSEVWNFNASYDKGLISFYIRHPNLSYPNGKIISSNLKNTSSVSSVSGIKIGNYNSSIYISVPQSELSTLDTIGFKQWLQANPITVVCQLAEPIIEELPNGITLQGFDDTTMYIENSITPTVSYGYNALIPYKEELSQQKEEVEINTLDIENNIIPYLMDMEFNLMTMEDK